MNLRKDGNGVPTDVSVKFEPDRTYMSNATDVTVCIDLSPQSQELMKTFVHACEVVTYRAHAGGVPLWHVCSADAKGLLIVEWLEKIYNSLRDTTESSV